MTTKNVEIVQRIYRIKWNDLECDVTTLIDDDDMNVDWLEWILIFKWYSPECNRYHIWIYCYKRIVPDKLFLLPQNMKCTVYRDTHIWQNKKKCYLNTWKTNKIKLLNYWNWTMRCFYWALAGLLREVTNDVSSLQTFMDYFVSFTWVWLILTPSLFVNANKLINKIYWHCKEARSQ